MFIGPGKIRTFGEGEKSPLEKVVVEKTVKRNDCVAEKVRGIKRRRRRRCRESVVLFICST